MRNKDSIDSYLYLKLVKETYKIILIYGWYNYRLLRIQVDDNINVIDKKGFKHVLKRIIRNKTLVNLNCGLCGDEIYFYVLFVIICSIDYVV